MPRLPVPRLRPEAWSKKWPTPASGLFRMLASPLKLETTPPTIRRHPPMLGEHTDEVLVEVLGLSSEQVAGLRGTGAIA